MNTSKKSTNKDIICRWEVYIQRRKICIQYPIPPVGFSFFRVFWCQFPLKPPGILNEDDSVTFSDSAVWNPFDFFLGDMMRVIFRKRLHSHEKTLETSCRDPCQTREVITLPMTICMSMAFKAWECCLPFSSRRWAGCQDI